MYLSTIIDSFDGMVVSWTIGTSPDAEWVNTMLDAAIETVAETGDRPLVHSDRGGHYRWPGWLSRMSDGNLPRSMSRKACSPDNAVCEDFFGRLKNELFYPRDWKNATMEQFIEAVDSYIRWYNEKRIKISLGSLDRVAKCLDQSVLITAKNVEAQRRALLRRSHRQRPGEWRPQNSGISIVNATTAEASKGQEAKTVFVPVSLPPPVQPAHVPDVRIGLRRGPIVVTVTWPASAGSECAIWMRELLR